MGSVVFQQLQDTGSIPSWHRRLKDPALPQLWLRSQKWLGYDPWPRNSIGCGVDKREKEEVEVEEKKQKKKKKRPLPPVC